MTLRCLMPEPCTCNTNTPCTAKLLQEHFKNTYFACSPGGPDLEAITRYLSDLSEKLKKDSPPTQKILSKKKSPDCDTHAWRKYGTKRGKIHREYYKCKNCDLRKRLQLKMDKKTKKMIEVDCQIGNKM